MRNGGAAQKAEAPRSINRAMPEGRGIAGFPFGIGKHGLPDRG